MKYDLSICIPARNEEFLSMTVENILKNKRGKTEIIVGLDGEWATPAVKDHPDVNVIHYSESIGQRAITNQCVNLSRAKYIMKVDAHCTFDEGFDVKMMEEMQDNWTMVPTMYNLHAFDWICENCNWREYQAMQVPDKCPKCGGKAKKDIVFKRKTNPRNDCYRFDNTLHFQYWGGFKERPEAQGDIVETMSIQGSCFMITREKYQELNICDEAHGSWGQQGVEVALKTWLSGGRVVVNKKTWYAHLFRTQGGTFGFPYHNSEEGIQKARRFSRDLWFGNKFEKQIHSLSWLLEKFKPIPCWHEEEGKPQLDEVNKAGEEFKKVNVSVSPVTKVSKGILYYTDNRLEGKIMSDCQKQIKKANLPIVSVSLKKIDFGNNIAVEMERGPLTMFRQILAGLRMLETDVVFFTEHDVLYHTSHFDFIPQDKDTFYYNSNVWFLRLPDGHTLHYDARQLSGLCAYRKQLIKHYQERIALVEKEGYSNKIGYEPMTHGRIKWQNLYQAEGWESKFPNVDIKHGQNLTPARWRKDQFRNQRFVKGWTEGKDWEVPGWDNLKKIL